jgi:hypothetical protein
MYDKILTHSVAEERAVVDSCYKSAQWRAYYVLKLRFSDMSQIVEQFIVWSSCTISWTGLKHESSKNSRKILM